MSGFRAKMHQIRFLLGLRPRPRWGAYSAPPDPRGVFKGLLLRGGKVKGDGKGRGQKGYGRVAEGKGEHGCFPQLGSLDAPVQVKQFLTDGKGRQHIRGGGLNMTGGTGWGNR